MCSDRTVQEVTYIAAPREGVNDDVVRVVEWRIADGASVSAGEVVAVVETTKAAIDIVASCSGFLFHVVGVNAEVTIGAPVAAISSHAARPEQFSQQCLAEGRTSPSTAAVVTAKARPLMQRHGLTEQDFPALSVIRAADVERLLTSRPARDQGAPLRHFRGEPLDPTTDWDGIMTESDLRNLTSLLEALRRRMKAKFDRHVPTGSLLHDRWQLARDHGFGEGTSVYDECLILGQVTVGKNCWIGPFTVLDGQGGLSIGDFVDIGAGAHIYSHNTIERALTGHRAPLYRNATKIGNCCFIAPHAVVGAGTVLGDHCFVASGSYVEGIFPARSYIGGSPARIVGQVVVRGDRAFLQRASHPAPASGSSASDE